MPQSSAVSDASSPWYAHTEIINTNRWCASTLKQTCPLTYSHLLLQN